MNHHPDKLLGPTGRRWGHRALALPLGLLLGCGGAEPAPVPGAAPAPGTAPSASPGPAPGAAPSAGPFLATPSFELAPAPEGPSRTIVLVSLDTVSAPHLALYGGPAETPALAAVAAQGRRYADAVTHFPQTCLSHWSMMTGVLPELHGNAPAHAGSVWTGPTLAEIATRGGYATAAVIGGVTLQDRACGLSRGFASYDDQFAIDPADMRRPAAAVTAAALRALERFGDQPGFLFVHYFDAHFPYTPAPPWDERYDPDYTGTLTGSDAALRAWRDGDGAPPARERDHVAALYQGELSALDQALAPLLAAVPDDAVLVVTSDHGESFQHAPWFNHRGALWEDVLRIPLILRAPGLDAGTVDSAPVGLIDLAPTVLALAGLPADLRMQGRNLTAASTSTPQWSSTDPWLGPQELTWREGLEGEKLRYLPAGGAERYALATDPLEARPTALPAARPTDYHALIAQLAAHQTTPPAPRGVSSGEAERLEALGYVDPTRAPGRAPNPRPGSPPGRRGGKAPGKSKGPPTGARPPGG